MGHTVSTVKTLSRVNLSEIRKNGSINVNKFHSNDILIVFFPNCYEFFHSQVVCELKNTTQLDRMKNATKKALLTNSFFLEKPLGKTFYAKLWLKCHIQVDFFSIINFQFGLIHCSQKRYT